MPDKKPPRRPEWTPDNAGEEFATRVMKGVRRKEHTQGVSPARRRELSVDDYVDGVLRGDSAILARVITLIESNASHHIDIGQEVLQHLSAHRCGSIRVGITGVPGAGKSTFIEALGLDLIRAGHRLAVLAVDPSSSRTRGSILGDKTRMELLSRERDCFIRPSPSGGELGGVTRKTRETIALCEAADYDVILVETVGVGQNEITVRSMVDFFLLLKIAGAGDELQAIKKGVVELADAVVINKADGANREAALLARSEFERALHYLAPATPGWRTPSLVCSAHEHTGIDEIWEMITRFRRLTDESGEFERRRRQQAKQWMHAMLRNELTRAFYQDETVKTRLAGCEREVEEGKKPVTQAVRELLELYRH
ncbi:MAG: methylmalonyl Co-A mutase-associated GTPase MeaB [Candidatus Cloacimonetes bacterium]|nr:methylmalonyl Co-A mutase-associated GTPase MeaB [Candidatus Cloacimonadota bacterium]